MNKIFLINSIMKEDSNFVDYMNLKDIIIDKIDNESGTNEYLTKIKYINGIYFIFGTNGRLYRSTDTILWTKCNISILNEIYDIIYAKKLYIVIGGGGKIVTSPDAVLWTIRISGVTNTLQSIAFGDDKFIIVGSPKAILSSNDGITWTPISFPEINPINGNVTIAKIIYNGTEFLLFINILTDGVITSNIFYSTTGLIYIKIINCPSDIIITNVLCQDNIVIVSSNTNVYKILNKIFYKIITNTSTILSINYSEGLFLVGIKNKVLIIFENDILQIPASIVDYYTVHIGSSINNRDIYGGLIVDKKLILLDKFGYILRVPIYYK